ncbi:MAG: hypothetical protein RLZZ540_594 [Bacteroidota bacterium]|jgi:hypothetical protein
MRYLFIFLTIPFYGQILHHQMLSSQGVTTKTSDGYIISQTIGQQSAIGNSNNTTVVIQGFQQSLWGTYIASNEKTEISTQTYPNPFAETVNFQFSQLMPNQITVYVFDISGHLVFEKKETIHNSILTINLANLPQSEYLVRLQATNFNYYTKIIKL